MLTQVPRLTVLLVSFAMLSGCLGSAGEEAARTSDTTQVAEAAFSVGDYAEAARLYERVSQSAPGSVTALIGLGRSYAAMGQTSRAEGALMRARELNPRNPLVLNELGRLALGQGSGEKALAQYDAALTQDRRNLGALTGRAVTLDYLSRHAEAQEVYRQALGIYPTNFVLMSNQSLSMVLSGQGAAGIALMEELRRDPNQGSEVLPNLAMAHAIEGNISSARSVLKGNMSEARITQLLRRSEEARKARAAGQPIGHLIFQ